MNVEPELHMATTTDGSQHKLLRNLTPEVFQTEVSASRHCRREARRNPGTPPAQALLAVAEHADRSLALLRTQVRAAGLPVSVGGGILGATFSELRERVADYLMDGERSYRATLLGVRHGVDVVKMFGLTAALARKDGLAEWAEDWLGTRTKLAHELERQIEWFALHTDRALARSH